MTKKISFLLAALAVGSIAVSAHADGDTPGSSTIPEELKGTGNEGKTTYVNVHSGKTVDASSKVGSTDAYKDSHPFEAESTPSSASGEAS